MPFFVVGGITPLSAGYQGIGDIPSLPAPVGFWSLRAYNNAKALALTPLVNIYDNPGTAGPTTINSLSTGALDEAAVVATGYGTYRAGRLYDQIGTNHLNFTGSAGNSPQLVLNGHNTNRPLIRSTGGTVLQCSAGAVIAQPFTVSFIARSNSAGSQFGTFGTASGANAVLCAWLTTTTANMYAGTNSAAETLTVDTMYALQHMFSGASSKMQVNGNSPVTKNPNTNSLGSDWEFPGVTGFSGFEGDVIELIIWNQDASAFFNAVRSNQNAYWGAL